MSSIGPTGMIRTSLQPAPPPAPTPFSTIIAQAISSAHKLAEIFNSIALNDYNLAKKNAAQWQETAPAGVTVPRPVAPTLVMVNDDTITADELADVDYSSAFVPYRYVDPNPAVSPAPTPEITIDFSKQLGPGMYRAGLETHTLPAGYLHEQGGHKYVLQFTPMMGPMWQQVS